MNEAALDMLVVILTDQDIGEYEQDETNYPMVGPSNPWRDLLRYLLWGELPPGHRVICGFTIPEYAQDREGIANIATAAEVAFAEQDDAEAIRGKIIQALLPGNMSIVSP